MFWGHILREGKPLLPQKIFETAEFAVLHLSAAVIDTPELKPTKLYVKNSTDPELLIASLS